VHIGAALGNRRCYAELDPEGDLENLWGVDDSYWCGALRVELFQGGVRLATNESIFHPAYARARFEFLGGKATKTAFVPLTPPLCAVVWEVEVENSSETDLDLELRVNTWFPPNRSTAHTKKPPAREAERRVISERAGDAVIGCDARYRAGQWEADTSRVRAFGSDAPPVDVRFTQPSRAYLAYHLQIPPNGAARRRVALVGGAQSVEGALQALQDLLHADDILEETVEELERILRKSTVITPSAEIDRAVGWAKVGTLRVQHDYPRGAAFTNNPPQDPAVVRDMAWYGMGCDYLNPRFTRHMYELIQHFGVEQDGKLTEFIRCSVPEGEEFSIPDPGFLVAVYEATARPLGEDFRSFVAKYSRMALREDYDLSANDNTPLFVVAAHHHYAVTGDDAFLRRTYPTLERAMAAMLAQKGPDGLIYARPASLPGSTNVWGSASWRNVTNGYSLDGAVTEINCLVVWALNTLAELAGEVAADGGRWQEEAVRLKDAINRRLLDPEGGLYLLAIESDGTARREVTSDLVFPLLSGVAEGKVREDIISLILGPTVWTSWGARTIPDDQPEWDPEYGNGAMGGIWPNMTAWIAYAVRRERPEAVSQAMERLALPVLSTEAARWGNVSPGAFPEWLSGVIEGGPVSRGMAASPWMPPTYLWLAVEGLLGIEPGMKGLKVEPSLPEEWRWAAVRDLPYRGSSVSVVYCDGTIYATTRVESPHPVELYQEDVTERVLANCQAIALRRTTEVALLLVGPESGRAEAALDGHRVTESLEPGAARMVRLELTGP
jgi:hypothetical protein